MEPEGPALKKGKIPKLHYDTPENSYSYKPQQTNKVSDNYCDEPVELPETTTRS